MQVADRYYRASSNAIGVSMRGLCQLTYKYIQKEFDKPGVGELEWVRLVSCPVGGGEQHGLRARNQISEQIP